MSYPTIANCNYESNETDAGRAVHAARKAVERGLTDDTDLVDALDALEETLTEELSESGEFERGVLSEEACNAAESAVVSAWLEVEATVDAARREAQS